MMRALIFQYAHGDALEPDHERRFMSSMARENHSVFGDQKRRDDSLASNRCNQTIEAGIASNVRARIIAIRR
jgi:hypothetical protein